MKLPSNNILFGIAAIIVLGGIVWYFFSGSPEGAPLQSVSGTAPIETRFLKLTGELNPVVFNTKVFSHPTFIALTSFAVPIVAEDVGRPDPFAPFVATTTRQ